ncbi:MAG: hypothetical protein ACXACX_14115 [Candidatus Hodarchaeales archaeon]
MFNTVSDIYLSKIKERMNLISSINAFFIFTNSGSSLHSIINSLYKDNETLNDLVERLLLDMDSFIKFIHLDFMQELGSDIKNQKETDETIIDLENFKILILGTASFRIFVFLRENPSQFTGDTFRQIIEDLEKIVSETDLLTREIFKKKITSILRSILPLTLFSPFIIDPVRIKFLENDIKKGLDPQISIEAILALKRLILLRTGSIKDLDSTPHEQGKEFNKLFNKIKLREKEIHYYDVAFDMLKRILKVPTEVIFEAFWVGSNEEVSILVPDVSGNEIHKM